MSSRTDFTRRFFAATAPSVIAVCMGFSSLSSEADAQNARPDAEPLSTVAAVDQTGSHYDTDLPPSPRGLQEATLAEPSEAARPTEQQAYLSTGTPTQIIESPEMPSLPDEDDIQQASIDFPELESPAQTLVLAATIAETATTESEFSRIIKLCESAAKQSLDGDSMQYASTLASWALNRRGELRDEAGLLDDALADFQRSVRLDENRWRAVHNRGVSFARMGRYHDAFADMSKTLQRNPSFAKAYSNRAALYEAAGDAEAALRDYRQAIELDVTLAAAHAGRGRVCHGLGRLDIALIELNEAIRIEPKNGNYHALRGDVLADSGRYEQALDAYGRAIEVEPDLATAYRNGAWLLSTCPVAELRNTENALLGAEQALELSESDRHLALDTLAAAFANANQFDEAVATMKQALAQAPPQFRSFYNARLKLYQAGRPYRSQPIRNEK